MISGATQVMESRAFLSCSPCLSNYHGVARLAMSSHPLKVNHLVIVCGHGIWLGGAKKGWDESEWLIESYKAGETPTFIEHIKAGIRVLTHDNRAVLVFSG